MHEVLLYGQVPATRHGQVLKILAGVAAMQPRRILQRCIVYKPQREPEEPGLNQRRGGTQNVAPVKQTKQATAAALYYTKLVQKLDESDFGLQVEGEGKGGNLSADVKDGEAPKWSVRWEDLPDAGDRGVSIRDTSVTDIVSGHPHEYMIATGPNRFVTEYFIEGHRLILNNIIIFLHRIVHEPGVRSLESTPKITLPSFASLQLLDMSGAWILEAKIRVQDKGEGRSGGVDDKVLDEAVQEMKAFQTQMRGCVELSVPERLSLDTRVKYRNPHLAVGGQVRR